MTEQDSIFENDSIFDNDAVKDPKQSRYEGDLKAEIVKVILEHKHELGPLKYSLQGAYPEEWLAVIATELSMTDEEIVSVVDRTVSRLIGELLEFDHRYNTSFPAEHLGTQTDSEGPQV